MTELITKEIENLYDPLLKEHLAKAIEASDASRVEKLIYEASI